MALALFCAFFLITNFAPEWPYLISQYVSTVRRHQKCHRRQNPLQMRHTCAGSCADVKLRPILLLYVSMWRKLASHLTHRFSASNLRHTDMLSAPNIPTPYCTPDHERTIGCRWPPSWPSVHSFWRSFAPLVRHSLFSNTDHVEADRTCTNFWLQASAAGAIFWH